MRKFLCVAFIAVLVAASLFSVGCERIGNEDNWKNKAPEGAQFEPPASGEEYAIIHTNFGDIKCRLFPEQAPKAVENFVDLAKRGYYDNLTFHRVQYNFMIQGGDPNGDGSGGESKWGEPFEDEFGRGLFHFRGALSMANKGPNTNGSQFFIVQCKEVKDTHEGRSIFGYMKANGWPQYAIDKYREVGGTPSLDGIYMKRLDPQRHGHTVFGHVFEGMDVVDKIAQVNTDRYQKPLEPVIIETIEITTMP